jgi:hypothetical protein
MNEIKQKTMQMVTENKVFAVVKTDVLLFCKNLLYFVTHEHNGLAHVINFKCNGPQNCLAL